MGHIALVGDSIFDNASYVPGGPSVIEHLRKALKPGWNATLLAVDGAVAEDVAPQLKKLPNDVTHIVVSVGGNDAIGEWRGLYEQEHGTIASAVSWLGALASRFESEYRQMIEMVLQSRKPIAVCTIYDAIPILSSVEKTGLAIFNDVIIREAARHSIPVIDLRLICNEEHDYSPLSPIEPSVVGGAKIARAVLWAVETHDFANDGCRIYVSP